jgi:hypothetical protein
VKQSVGRLDRDRFAGEVTADVIAVNEDADAPGAIDAATDGLLSRLWILFRGAFPSKRMRPPEGKCEVGEFFSCRDSIR